MAPPVGYADSVARANKALSTARAAQGTYATAQTELAGARAALTNAGTKVTKLTSELNELKKHPQRNAKAIATKEKELVKATAAQTTAAQRVNDLAAGLATADGQVKAAQAEALKQEQAANDLARLLPFTPPPFAGASQLDSLQDAASMNAAQHQRLLGGPTHYSQKEALEADVRFITAAAKASPENGAKALAMQLEQNPDPAYQKQLIAQAGPAIDAIIAGALNPKNDFFAQGPMAKELILAVAIATPEVRDALAEKIAKFNGSGALNPSLSEGLAEAMIEHGKGFDLASTLIQKFGPTSKAADEVKGVEATAIGKLRDEFHEKHEKTAKLEAELGLLVAGFGPMMESKDIEKAITAFKDKHVSEFAATNEAAEKLAGAFEIESQTKNAPNKAGQQELQAALKDLGTDFNAWSATPAGGEHLEKAVVEQSLGKDNWLSNGVNFLKDAKDGADNLAKGVTRAIASASLSGSFKEAAQSIEALKRNAGILGIADPEKLGKELQSAFTNEFLPGGREELTKLTRHVEAGEFGKSKTAINAIKIATLGLGVYSAIDGIKNWGEKGALERVKLVVDATRTGGDGVAFVASMLGKASVAEKFAKVGGLGVITGAIDAYGGVRELADGNWRDGVGDLSMGLGGIAMGIASVSSVIPGWGQAIAGVAIVGGFIWKKTLGSDPAREAELAAQKDANEFLRAGGFSPVIANGFDDLLQTDHHNAGFVVAQLEQKLGMPKGALMKKLAEAEVDQPGVIAKFVDMAIDVPLDKDFKIAATKKDAFDQVETGMAAGGIPIGPHSLETVQGWLKQNHVALP